MRNLNEQISEVIAAEPVTLFMKGTPQMIMCGNSHRALQALHAAGAPVTAVDVLPDPRICQELSEISGWPIHPTGLREGRADRRRGHHRGAVRSPASSGRSWTTRSAPTARKT